LGLAAADGGSTPAGWVRPVQRTAVHSPAGRTASWQATAGWRGGVDRAVGAIAASGCIYIFLHGGIGPTEFRAACRVDTKIPIPLAVLYSHCERSAPSALPPLHATLL
jgi:hypothetical protein